MIEAIQSLLSYFFISSSPEIQHNPKIQTQAEQITSSFSEQKMLKNFYKSIEEHRDKHPSYVWLNDPKLPSVAYTPLSFSVGEYGAQGIRPTMEDEVLFHKSEDGALIAVFDGHGGDKVAKFAKKFFEEHFFVSLQANSQNIHQTFYSIFNDIQNEVEKVEQWSSTGSTAVVSYIDRKTNNIYTATLGDSEANIYRSYNGNIVSIPLSCVRDWSSKKDAQRAAVALNDPNIAVLWPNKPAKSLRFPFPYAGLNVSRALGDREWKYFHVGIENCPPAISHKPKITMHQLQPGDRLVLACDGLKDYVEEEQIANICSQNQSSEKTAEKLVNFALYDRKSKDNVSVIVMDVFADQ